MPDKATAPAVSAAPTPATPAPPTPAPAPAPAPTLPPPRIPRDAGVDESGSDEFAAEFSDPPAPVVADKAPTAPTPKPADRPAPKPDEKPAEAKPALFDPALGKQSAADKRSYDNMPEEAATLLRSLSNSQYNAWREKLPQIFEKAKKHDELAPKLTELETKLAERPNFLHENPRAFVLEPEYQQLQQNQYYLSAEYNHYQEQLEKIEAGEPWQVIEGFNQKTGDPIYKTIPAPENGRIDTAAKARIVAALATGASQVQNAQLKLQQFEQSYAQRGQQTAQYFTELENKLFPGWDDAKLPPNEAAVLKAALDLAPAPFRNHAMARINARAAVMYHKAGVIIGEQAKKIAQLEAIIAGGKAAEPIPSADGSTASGESYSLEDEPA